MQLARHPTPSVGSLRGDKREIARKSVNRSTTTRFNAGRNVRVTLGDAAAEN
jgi:hypothetical protein